MAKTILGYPIASAEQQRKTAIAIFGFVAVAAIASLGVIFFITHMEQNGREQGLATITDFTTMCRYRVRNISGRVSFYDHTGYVDCPTARRVAAENNSSLGQVEQATFAKIRFVTRDGVSQNASVILGGTETYSRGQQIEVLYRTNDPTDVTQSRSMPLGLGKQSIVGDQTQTSHTSQGEGRSANHNSWSDQVAGAPSTKSRSKRIAEPKSRASDTIADSTKVWVGLGLLFLVFVGALYVLRFIWRTAKRLAFGISTESNVNSIQGKGPCKHSNIDGYQAIPQDRIARVMAKPMPAGRQ